MEIKETIIKGCFEIFPKSFKDMRGKLIKTFHLSTFEKLGLNTTFDEEYYSISNQGVLRGLHFQLPPEAHIKCVTCLRGKIFDVVVDLRKGSPSFGKHFSTILCETAAKLLYIPVGCAHGFYALEDNSIFLNRSSKAFSAEHDMGIRWDSCGINWPDEKPLLSDKDLQLIKLEEFESRFVYE